MVSNPKTKAHTGSGGLGGLVLSLAIREKQMAKTLNEVYVGNIFVIFHNTSQEYSYCIIF